MDGHGECQTRFLNAACVLGIVAASILLPPHAVAQAPSPTVDARLERQPPRLDPAVLHARWRRSLVDPRAACRWPTYHVAASSTVGGQGTVGRPFGTLNEALAAAAGGGICGPTIVLRSGRHEIGVVSITKPTILVGAADTTIVGTIVNTTGAPLWLQNLVIADAPEPGALLVSHPRADTTLVHVTVLAASGFGVLHNGGRLEAWHTRVEGTTVLPRAHAADRPLLGPSAVDATRARPTVDHPGRLGSVLVSLAARRDRMGRGVISLTRKMLRLPPVFAPIDPGALGTVCSGTGLYISGGGYTELNDVSLHLNDSAGLAVQGAGTWVNAYTLAAGLNGLSPAVTVATLEDFLDSSACLGGITVRGGALFVETATLTFNTPVGAWISGKGFAGFGDFHVTSTLQSEQGAWGDNVTVFGGSFVALSDFSLVDADRAGLFLAGSIGNAVSGQITGNRFGIALVLGSSLYLDDVDNSLNSEQNLYTDGGQPIADEPLPVPKP